MRFSVPSLIIVNLPFAVLMVARHWAGVFIELSVLLHMLVSYLHRTCVYPSDHNLLRAHHFIWKGRIAPFPGVHHFMFMDIKHHVPSHSAVIQTCTIHLSDWLVSVSPQKLGVFNNSTLSSPLPDDLLVCQASKVPGYVSTGASSWPLFTVKNHPLTPALCLLPHYLSRRKLPLWSCDNLVSKILTLFKIFFHSSLLTWARGLFSASLLITLSPS